MNKKGFTLIELLAVIVLIAVITSIGTVGIVGVKEKIKKDMWQKKIELIENRAQVYGEDNKALLTGRCIYYNNGVSTTFNNCLSITIGELIKQNYLSTKEKDSRGNKIISNDTLSKSDPNYSVNNKQVYIYLENDMVYAKYSGS
ncbi:MAG: type II secretion system GspH family protein [Bacilli bacterium]|nr:type II secretion system GspH family protein [Bacilli bacterium]